jgi:hypothetical protein
MRAVLARNVETGVDAHNNPLPPRYEEFATDVPCFVWSKSSTAQFPGDRTANIELLRGGFALDQDIREEDRIVRITCRRGEQVIYENLRIDARPQYKHRHLEVDLKRVD